MIGTLKFANIASNVSWFYGQKSIEDCKWNVHLGIIVIPKHLPNSMSPALNILTISQFIASF